MHSADLWFRSLCFFHSFHLLSYDLSPFLCVLCITLHCCLVSSHALHSLICLLALSIFLAHCTITYLSSTHVVYMSGPPLGVAISVYHMSDWEPAI